MLVRIKDNKAEILQETHTEERHPACIALDRVKDELAGFMEYKQLNKHNAHSRYALASEQEFQHMLLALDDFFAAVIPELSTEEHAELNKFFKAVTPSM
jgi:hypothetical protein